MPKQNQGLIRKVVKIHENQQSMLDTFTEKWGFVSESEVIRAAIVFMYKKWEPEYLQPSSREKDRKDKQTEAQRLQKMDNEKFALEVLKGVIKLDREGKKWVLSHRLGNNLYCIPLDKIKQFAQEDDSWALKYNLQELAKGKKIEDQWEFVKNMLIPRHNLVEEETTAPAVSENPAPDEASNPQPMPESFNKIQSDLEAKLNRVSDEQKAE